MTRSGAYGPATAFRSAAVASSSRAAGNHRVDRRREAAVHGAQHPPEGRWLTVERGRHGAQDAAGATVVVRLSGEQRQPQQHVGCDRVGRWRGAVDDRPRARDGPIVLLGSVEQRAAGLVPEIGDQPVHQADGQAEIVRLSQRGVGGQQAIGQVGVVLGKARRVRAPVARGAPHAVVVAQQVRPHETHQPSRGFGVPLVAEHQRHGRDRTQRHAVPGSQLLAVARRAHASLSRGQQGRPARLR